MTQRRIYLDHAATSWPKSNAVLAAMHDFQLNCGVSAGRGDYGSASEASRTLAQTRRRIAELIHAPSENCISFHASGTLALNAAIYGILKPGDHIVTTAAEHNSVLRPLHQMAKQGTIKLDVAPVNPFGIVETEELLSLVTDQTSLVAVTGASNVTGGVQPIQKIGSRLKQLPCRLLCDAAQTFGGIPIDVQASAIDLLAAPGHKCSGGPLGTALLYVAPDLHEFIAPSVLGGTGSVSESLEMPGSMPGKLEPGSLNVPAIAGWLAALNSIDQQSIEDRMTGQLDLSYQMHQSLGQCGGIKLFSRPSPIAIASLQLYDLAPSDLSMILDSEFRIETRSGYHCAALIHRFLGSESCGTLRISLGEASLHSDVQYAVDCITSVSKQLAQAN